MTRRTALAIGGVAASRLFATNPKRPPVFFNWDGSVIHCWGRTLFPNSPGPLTRDQFVSLVFTPLEDAGVDALLFSFGSGNVAEYQSNVLEWPGQADKFRFPSSKTWHGGVETDPADQYRNPKALADAGHNPPAVIVEECRKRGIKPFVSLRMNDCHDGLHPKGSLPNPELPTFKRQNPDWLVQDLDRWTALDFRRPQVRDLKLRVVEEFFERWDFDGIELDWLRHTLYFPRGTERENGKYLTALLRNIRESLNRQAAKRGRAIEIAVRIPERLDWCGEAGFEVPVWIAENLVDMLILGQGLSSAPHLHEFRSLMKARAIPIFGSLYSYGNGYALSPDPVILAEASNLSRDGVDGLYTFNWSTSGTWRKPVLKQIDKAGGLRHVDKHYVLPQRFEAGRIAGTDYLRFNSVYRDAPVPLELKVADGPKTLVINVAESPRNAELWIAVEYSEPGDELSVKLNGTPLRFIGEAADLVGFRLELPPGNGMIGMPFSGTVDMRFPAFHYSVQAGIVASGQNKLMLELKHRGKGSDMHLQVTRVELSARNG